MYGACQRVRWRKRSQKLQVFWGVSRGAYVGDTLVLGARVPTWGGVPLRTLHLDDAAFAPPAMQASGDVPFEQMKLAHLKEELAARGARRSGLKAVLQRRLHGLLVEAVIAEQAAEAEASGVRTESDDEAASGDGAASDDESDGDDAFWADVEAATARSKKRRMYVLFGTDSEGGSDHDGS